MSTENMDNIIVLNDEEGNEIECEGVAFYEYKGNEYAVLLPLEGDEVIILKVEESDDPDMEEYVPVESEEELMAVFEMFKEEFKDEIDFAE